MAVNRFDQAQPAQDNYFNTFVPMPMNELTQLGMSKQKDLERNQAMIDKAYNDVLNIQAMPGADETTVKTQIIPAMTDIAQKYATVDLTDPQQMAALRREMRTRIDPNVVNRIEQSHAGYLQAQESKRKLSAEGKYNPLLDEDPYATWDSAHQGVYNYAPRAYEGKSNLFKPYFDNMKESFKGIQNGLMYNGTDLNDVNMIAKLNAADLVGTPAGQDELKLFKKQYPSIAAKYQDDTQIMERLMTEYGSDRIHNTVTPLPAGWGKEYGSGKTNGGDLETDNLHGIYTPKVESFNSLVDVKSKIQELMQGNPLQIQQGKDLQAKLADGMKKYGITENTDVIPDTEVNPNPMGGLNQPSQKLFNKSTSAEGLKALNDQNDKITSLLNEISSSVSKKYSYGSPTYQNMTEEDLKGKKVGYNSVANLSTDVINNPTNYEIGSISGYNKVPVGKKLQGALSGLQTKELTNFTIDTTPTAENGYKPKVRFEYTNSKTGAVTKVEASLNDPSNQHMAARVLHERNDYSGEAAVTNSHIAQDIDGTDFTSAEKTYKVGTDTPDGDVPIKIKRDGGGFLLRVPVGKDKNKNFMYSDHHFNNREELKAGIWDFVAKNTDHTQMIGQRNFSESE
jgi:hypothetical protein